MYTFCQYIVLYVMKHVDRLNGQICIFLSFCGVKCDCKFHLGGTKKLAYFTLLSVIYQRKDENVHILSFLRCEFSGASVYSK